jgi:hypothetical protein
MSMHKSHSHLSRKVLETSPFLLNSTQFEVTSNEELPHLERVVKFLG